MDGLPGSHPTGAGGSPPDVEIAMVGAATSVADLVSTWVEHTAHEMATGSAMGPDPANGLPGGAFAAAGRGKSGKAAAKKQSVVAQRRWLMIDTEGDTRMTSLNKYDLTQDLGIQLRDLRLLDPKLAASYPSAILCRERSLVVNLEYIKMIVGLDRCYVTNLEDESTTLFVAELQRRLSAVAHGLPPTKSTMDLSAAVEAASSAAAGASPVSTLDELPFELRVLECALDVVSAFLERLTSDLEAAAHPALDALTRKVTTGNLERVRRVKNRMVRLTTRVETLKELLEKFLDDDSDMRDMNLASKEARDAQDRAHDDRLRHGSGAQPFDVMLPATDTKTPGSPRSAALTYDSDEEEEEAVEVVEQLLESYFMQVDNTWNKLQTLTEYVSDTEDFINIQLDSQRNQLIRLDLVLTSFSASVALITAITGLFAMNVMLAPDQTDKAPYSWFVAIAATSAGVAILLFLGVMAYCRWKRLI